MHTFSYFLTHTHKKKKYIDPPLPLFAFFSQSMTCNNFPHKEVDLQGWAWPDMYAWKVH